MTDRYLHYYADGGALHAFADPAATHEFTADKNQVTCPSCQSIMSGGAMLP
jgi:hypothetical protein